MRTTSVTEARASLPELITVASHEAVFLERRGKVAAVLISPERYARMVQALEDVDDIAAFDAALSEEGENIPWDQAKSDLGWV